MKRKLLITIASFLCILCVAGLGNATILTFDDVPGADPLTWDNSIPDSYGGLNWDNVYVLHKDLYPVSGYKNGVVSGEWVAYNVFELDAYVTDGVFDFNGAYLTAAWNDGLNIDVIGYLNGSQLYSQMVTVNTSGPKWFDFDYLGIDELYLHSYGGTWHEGYPGGGTHFVMDNFTYNTVPEPTTLLLLGLGITGLAVLRRKS